MRKKIMAVLTAGMVAVSAVPAISVCAAEKEVPDAFSMEASVRLSGTVTGLEEEPTEIDVDGNVYMEINTKDMLAYVKSEITAMGEQSTAECYAEKEDEELAVYTSENGDDWYKELQELPDFEEILQGTDSELKVSDFLGESTGGAEVNGIQCNHYEKNVSVKEIYDAFTEIAEEVDAEESEGDLSGTLEVLDGFLEYFEDTSILISYDEDAETEMPVYLVIDASAADLTGLNELLTEMVSEDFSIDVTDAVISMMFDYSDVTVEIPAEVTENALDADDFSGEDFEYEIDESLEELEEEIAEE